jgi:hypothetical protein
VDLGARVSATRPVSPKPGSGALNVPRVAPDAPIHVATDGLIQIAEGCRKFSKNRVGSWPQKK